MPKVRSVIVGPGWIGEVHARAIRRAGGDVVGVVGRTLGAAERAAAAWGVAAASDSLAEVLAETRPDVVHVCSPNARHAEQVSIAAATGAAIVCEKPLGTSALETARMVAETRELVTAVPFAYRFYPAVRELRARVHGGAAGAITLLHGSYLQDWLADPQATNWRADASAGGPSRAFADIGVHWCDLAEFVTGDRIASVVATTTAVYPRGGEDIAVLLFRTVHGATGSLRISQVSWGRKNRLELYVDTEQASFGFAQEDPNRLWVGSADGTMQFERGAGFTAPDAIRFDRVPAGHPQGYQDCFDALVADLHAALTGDVPDGMPTFADGHRAAVITEAVLASAASGVWTDVYPNASTDVSSVADE